MLVTIAKDGRILETTAPLQEGLNLRGTVRGRIDPETLEVRPLPSQAVDWQGASDRDGAFLHGNAALWRVQNGRLLYAMPDLAGIHDLFYASTDAGGWHIGDDFLEIARRLDRRTLDRPEIDFFIIQGRFRRGGTYFHEIRRSPIGNKLVPTSDGLQFESLFEGVYAETQSEQRTCEQFKRILTSVCEVETPGSADAVLLSGGWDSALVAALLRRLTPARFHAVTFAYQPVKGHNQTEIRDAARIAGHLDIQHHLAEVDFNALSAAPLSDLIASMPLGAHLGFPFLEGTRQLPGLGIQRA